MNANAEGRKAREVVKGRLPVGAVARQIWTGERWVGTITLHDITTGDVVKVIQGWHYSLWSLLTGLDAGFWMWYIQADAERKAKLTWAPEPLMIPPSKS